MSLCVDSIHIAVALHDPSSTYAQHLGVCLCSLFTNTSSPLKVHLLHDHTLSDENRYRFYQLADIFSQQIELYNIDSMLSSLALAEQPALQHFSPATLSRLFLPELLPSVSRLIYLDADMVVDMDIAELWQVDLGGRPLGAVPDLGIQRTLHVVPQDQTCDSWANGALERWQQLAIPLENYFNAGTLLLDLHAIRQNGLFDATRAYLQHTPSLPCPDQDALNAVFGESYYTPLPYRFNVMLSIYPTWCAGPCIWHFTGHKPWESVQTPRKDRYDLYLQHTPWATRTIADPLETRKLLGETTKSIPRRSTDNRFITRWFRGSGIDIGCGEDPLSAYMSVFPFITEVRSWDVGDGDAQLMPGVPDETYDFVHASNCLEYMVDPGEALKHWLRILKPGGHMIIIVPDEDLYEQGVFPSNFNPDHKWTFTMYKSHSWSERSINVFAMLAGLGSEVDVRRVEVLDQLYRYHLSRQNQALHPAVECFIEFVVRKRPACEIAQGGRLPSAYARPRSGTVYLQCDGIRTTVREIKNSEF